MFPRKGLGRKAQKLNAEKGFHPPPLWPPYCTASLKKDYDSGTGTTTPEQILRHPRSVSAGAVREDRTISPASSYQFFISSKKKNPIFLIPAQSQFSGRHQ